jgi:hypothetical protein
MAFDPSDYAEPTPEKIPLPSVSGAFNPSDYMEQTQAAPKTIGTRVGDAVNSFFGSGPVKKPAGMLDVGKGAAKAAAILVSGGGLLPMVSSGGLFGFGTSDAEEPWGLARDTVGGAAGGAAVKGGLWAGGRALAPVSTGLGKLAEKAAVRSSFADRTAYKAAFGKPANQGKVAETGRFLLDEGIPLRSPAAMLEGLGDKLAEVGPKVGALADKATKAGTKVDLEGAALRALQHPDVADLARNTETRAIGQRVGAFLEDQIAQHGNEVTPQTLWEIRRQLDPLSKWSKDAPEALTKAFRAVRRSIDGELGTSFEAAGLGAEWAAANKGVALAKTAKTLAVQGAERRAANRFVSPYEAIAGIGGAGATALAGPKALAIPAAAWVLNRYGMPVAARTMDAASKATGAMSRAMVPGGVGSTGGVLSPTMQAMADAIARRFGSPVGGVPSFATDRESPTP